MKTASVRPRGRRGQTRAQPAGARSRARRPRSPGSVEVLRGGQAWSRVVARGQILRITDTTGRACVSALFHNARDPIERYNMADTLKAQYTAFLTKGRVLFSDMGRILVSIIEDTCGWHDTITGAGNAAEAQARFGPGRYQELRNDFHRNAHDNLIVELSKRGLGRRDIVANVNFFVRISAESPGRLGKLGKIGWVAGNSHPGAHVDLRAEMDTLVVLTNTPHPLDPTRAYAPPMVELGIRLAGARELPGPRDVCRRARAENARGFTLTEDYVRAIARSPAASPGPSR